MTLVRENVYLQPCMTRPTLIDSNPDEYKQEFRCYPFMVNLNKCNGSCNILMVHWTEYAFQTKRKM